MHDLETHGVEYIWLKVSIKYSKAFLIGFINRNHAECIEWQERFNFLMVDNLLSNINLNEFAGILFVDFAKASDVKDVRR